MRLVAGAIVFHAGMMGLFLTNNGYLLFVTLVTIFVGIVMMAKPKLPPKFHPNDDKN